LQNVEHELNERVLIQIKNSGQRGEVAGVVADDLSVGFKFLASAE
jgi:hypothetical protein